MVCALHHGGPASMPRAQVNPGWKKCPYQDPPRSPQLKKWWDDQLSKKRDDQVSQLWLAKSRYKPGVAVLFRAVGPPIAKVPAAGPPVAKALALLDIILRPQQPATT